ncbi:hypothetical protein [Halosimplex sp. J119]
MGVTAIEQHHLVIKAGCRDGDALGLDIEDEDIIRNEFVHPYSGFGEE